MAVGFAVSVKKNQEKENFFFQFFTSILPLYLGIKAICIHDLQMLQQINPTNSTIFRKNCGKKSG